MGSGNPLCSIIEESATAFEVDQTKMLARKNKKGKTPYIELLKAKTPAEIEVIQIQVATRGHNNTNVYLASYAPVPPFVQKKIVEYNSSASQEIALSCGKALKSFEPTQAAIATLIYAPANIGPKSQPTKAPNQTTGGEMTINKEQSG